MLFVSILCYFIFCTVVSSIILMVTTLEQCPCSLRAILGYFWVQFWHIDIFSLISIQYFVMKSRTDVLDITLIITNPIFFWQLCPHLQGTILGDSGACYGILHLLVKNRSICSHEILYRRSWCSLHYFFPYHDTTWCINFLIWKRDQSWTNFHVTVLNKN